MTVLRTFATLEEAARGMGADAAYMGGGTILMAAVNAGAGPAALARVADPALRRLSVGGTLATLGAGATMAQLLDEPAVDFLHPAARAVGGPQLRNMATVGGNLFAPHPYGDLTVALLALGAQVVLAGGARRPLEDLLRERARAPGLVAAVEVARPQAGDFGFLKVSRVRPKGVSVLSVAALVPRQGGRVRGARVAWGAMGAAPQRGAAAERALEGQMLDDATLSRAAATAGEGLDPPSDALASAWYRREVAGVHLRRLLESLETRR